MRRSMWKPLIVLSSLLACSRTLEDTENRCNPPRTTLHHGDVDCTRENFVGSTCRFHCQKETGYELYPKGVTTSKCLPSLVWSHKEPCCARPCPPSARMDVFVILDSSSSVRAKDWSRMKIFVRNLIRSFTISDDTTHFSIVRYNRRVDTQSAIKLKDYPNDKESLLIAFDRIPHGGSGTRTGKAIQYVGDVLINSTNGLREDVSSIVIVFTDGRSQDNVEKPSIALRKRGVITYVVGISPPGRGLIVDELIVIAGSENNMWISNGFRALDDSLRVRILEGLCGDPCYR